MIHDVHYEYSSAQSGSEHTAIVYRKDMIGDGKNITKGDWYADEEGRLQPVDMGRPHLRHLLCQVPSATVTRKR